MVLPFYQTSLRFSVELQEQILAYVESVLQIMSLQSTLWLTVDSYWTLAARHLTELRVVHMQRDPTIGYTILIASKVCAM